MTEEELQAIQARMNEDVPLTAIDDIDALTAALREAHADTEAVKKQMQVAGDLAYKTERENLEEIARLERLVAQRDEEASEMRERLTEIDEAAADRNFCR